MCFPSRLPHPHPALAPLSPSRWVADLLIPTFLKNLEFCAHCLLSGLSLKGLSLKCLNSNSRQATQTLPGSNFSHLLILVFSMVQYLPSILSINKIPLFSGSSPPKCLPKPSPGLPLPCHLFPLRRCSYIFRTLEHFGFFRCYPIWVYLYVCRFIHTLLQVLTLEEIERQAAAVRI